jgi:hypothetical protein
MTGEEHTNPRGTDIALPSFARAVSNTHSGSPKYEKAAMRWLERYLVESSSRLQHFELASHLRIRISHRSSGSRFAEMTASLAKEERELETGGLN